MPTKRTFTAEFKAQVVLELLSGTKRAPSSAVSTRCPPCCWQTGRLLTRSELPWSSWARSNAARRRPRSLS